MKIYHPILCLILFLPPLFIPSLKAQCLLNEVIITSITEDYASEMSWELYDSTGTQITKFQGVNNNDTIIDTVCIPDGCHSFLAIDSYGDGWNGGSVTLSYDTTTHNFDLPGGFQQYFYFGIYESNCTPFIPGCTNPAAHNYDPSATVDDGSCMTTADIAALQIIDTLCWSGPKNNRINFVLQNRGTSNPSGTYVNMNEFVTAFDSTFLPAFTWGDPGAKQPYAQYKSFFNLHASWWPNAPGDHTWWKFSVIQELRDMMFLPWANNETGWVTWFSTTKNGGGGGAGLNRIARVGDGKMFGTEYETLLHEFGHTMPGLLDEYTSSGVWSGNQCFETPNTTGYTIKDSIPWRKWIDDNTPLPTPYDGQYENVIGGFEGALTNYFGCHRPTAKGCYMGAGGFGEGYGDDLCAPCIQRVICFLYKYVNVIENPIPVNANIMVTGTQTIAFSADVVAPEPNTQKYTWLLNGKLIASDTTAIEITFGDCDTYELVFTVTDTTELVRYDEKFEDIYPRPYRERVWIIDQTDVNSYNLSSNATVTNADCTGDANGEVSFNNIGGQPPYGIWLDGELLVNPVKGLAQDNFTFNIVDAKGCTVEQSITISQDDLLDIEICSDNNGSWIVTVHSENYDVAQLNLLWSNGATTVSVPGLTDGSHSLTATNGGGCSITVDFDLVSSPDDLTVSDMHFPSEVERPTGAIYVEVNGGIPPYEITWEEQLIQDLTDDNPSNITASGTTWGHLPEMAFDNDPGTKWLHAVSNNAWIAYEFSLATTLAWYTITSGDDVPGRDPLDWDFEGSDDGTNWTLIDQRNGVDFPERRQKRTFLISNPTAYKHYRLYVTQSAGSNQIQLQELEFMGADPVAPFLPNSEYTGHFSRTQLEPGNYRYEVTDSSAACFDTLVVINTYQAFIASGLKVVQDGECGVTIETPNIAYDYYWFSDERGTKMFGTGTSFQPPSKGNFYVGAALAGSGQWSANRKGFAVIMPTAPQIVDSSTGTFNIHNPNANETYYWYDADGCGSSVHQGNSYTPPVWAGTWYAAARSNVTCPDPINPDTLPGLFLQMDASDLNGDGLEDDPAPASGSTYDWYFPGGNSWTENWFAYRANYQNGLGIADWATLWLQRIDTAVSNFQTVLLAYEENALSRENTAPMEALSATMPRHTDSTQLFGNNAPATTLSGSTYLNGRLVDPLITSNPMEFCVLGSVFTNISTANINYTDVHWEGKVGEMLFFDQALSDAQMKGVSEYMRQKWISTAELQSPRTAISRQDTITGVTPVFATNALRLYPNPASEWLAVQTEMGGPKVVRIFNIHGGTVQTQKLLGMQRLVDVSQLVSGLYLLEITGADGQRGIGQFVKQQ